MTAHPLDDKLRIYFLWPNGGDIWEYFSYDLFN